MAQVKAHRPVKYAPDGTPNEFPTEYVLNLDFEEFLALRDVLDSVGGHPAYSRRWHTDKIRDAIIALRPSLEDREAYDVIGSIIFKEVESDL